jgi:hypothetical protein
MAVVDLKRAKRAKRTPRNPVPLDKATGAARFFDRMVREIENDLGGRRQLSRIEGELIRAFAGAQHAVAKTQIDQLFTGLSNALPHHFGNGNVFIGGTELWRFGRARLCERHIRKRP